MGIPSKQDLESLLGREIVEKSLRKGEFSRESTVMEMKEHSLLMKLVYFGFETVMAMKYGGRDYSNPTFKMMMTTAMDCSVSGMRINGGIKGHLLEGLVEIANGHLFKGLKMMRRK
jgi:beta-glucosidase